jgi:O-antigen/teichoic acid export membrane protein
MPRLAELVRDRPEAVHDLLRQLSHAMFLVALPLAAACSLTAPILVDTVFGDAYQSAALPLTILIWTTVTVYGNAPFGFLMLARSQDRAYMLTAIAGATVNVGLNVAIIPVFGLVGAAATSVVTEVLVFGLIVYATRDRSLDVLASSLRVAGPVAFITAVAIFPVRESLLAVPVGAAAYAGAMLMTGAVSISRIRIVLGVFRNQTS